MELENELEKRNDWVIRLRAEFQQDPRVKAIWLGGSLGRGAGDRWSDVDFYVAVEEEDFVAFFAEVPARIHRMQPILHHTDFAVRRQSPTERVWFLWFEGWPIQWKLDFHVHTTQSARGADPDQRRELLYGEWDVYYDPAALLAVQPPVDAPTSEMFKEHVQEEVDHLAWHFASASAHILRDDFWRGSSWLHTIHDRLHYLFAIEADATMMHDTYARRLTKAMAPADREALNKAVFDANRVSMAQSGLVMLRLFQQVAQRLCQKTAATYPETYVQAVEKSYLEDCKVQKA